MASRVALLLATYNGEPFLDMQMQSLAEQTVPFVDIWASDDGSTDATRNILRKWASRWQKGQFTIIGGPRAGFARNFASLLGNSAIQADCFAYCDQDDVWDPGKLERGIAWLKNGPQAEPRVYASRTRIIAADSRLIGQSPLFRHPPAFRNAIVQSIAGGNTMVLNRSARDLLAETVRRTGFVSHDWWTYIAVTGAGGTVHYDPVPRISYRQHDRNLMGSNAGLAAHRARIRGLLGGQYRAWNDINMAALQACADLLTPDSRRVLEDFERARLAPSPQRLYHLARSGIYRQTRLHQMALYAACAAGTL